LQERSADTPALRAALAVSPASFNASCDALRQSAIAAGKSKNYLDTLLLLEYGLSTGEALRKELTAFRAGVASDPDCQSFISTGMPHSRAAAERAVEVLRLLETKTTHGRPVLQILRANNLSELGKSAEAEPLLLSALEARPCIVGAWRDLGSVYHNRYEMGVAWQWWDNIRRVQPLGQSAKAIENLERKLVHDYPEFFLTRPLPP